MRAMFNDKELETMAKGIVAVVSLACIVAIVGLIRILFWIGETF